MSGPTRIPTLADTGEAHPKLSILTVCDEWTPSKGGISTFNRCLAIAAARSGHQVTCLVKVATPEEVRDARSHNVDLIAAPRLADGPNLNVPVEEVIIRRPDVVIGHDMVSGAVADNYVKRYITDAVQVLVIHNTPAANEPYKRTADASKRTAEREKVLRAINAHVVAAVGPKLAIEAEDLVDNRHGRVPILQLDPGMDIPPVDIDLRRDVPGTRTVLMHARATHIQPKGFDIAAQSLAGIRVPTMGPYPRLLIRGAEDDERADQFRDELVELSKLPRGKVTVFPYTTDVHQLDHDLRASVLCVMPSRDEGYGLAALKSIAAGTPVLVSRNSGVANTLSDRLGPLADAMIVDVVDDLEQDALEWRRRIQRVLDEPMQWFDYTHTIREALYPKMRWSDTVATLINRLQIAF
ncbi:glycosyltransferase family 4 protein [Kibdelosporangium persicum]|uniref:Glycosyltransferase involved in cell wall biosynthesis n=1 Tax=Kibdelosporangium persicum TaxID=2698649 RepID=A0ABX2EWT4_9PSEU|nr:glycosyltransferase family 4 protein [Kibdelosporangium persicum]NRN63444.1 Glycosyltransferase involved in cell wall biosynthesis [Kibdelosporangium persicum]